MDRGDHRGRVPGMRLVTLRAQLSRMAQELEHFGLEVTPRLLAAATAEIDEILALPESDPIAESNPNPEDGTNARFR